MRKMNIAAKTQRSAKEAAKEILNVPSFTVTRAT
jgi:hypothetical protein